MGLLFLHRRDKQLEIMKEMMADIKNLKRQIEQERVALYIHRSNLASSTSALEYFPTFTPTAMGMEHFDLELHFKERAEVQRNVHQQAPTSVRLIGDFDIDMIETSSPSPCNVENLVGGFDGEM